MIIIVLRMMNKLNKIITIVMTYNTVSANIKYGRRNYVF